MRAWVPLLMLLVACRGSGDENLGLTRGGAAVDVTKLTRPDELARALSLSGPDLDARLGAHRMDAAATLKLELPSHETQTLDDTWVAQSDAHGAVHLVHDNSRGNGFEAVALGKQLYVKPRYGRFVKSAIESDELSRLRTATETNAAAYVRLLTPFVQIREAGQVQVAGHAGLKLKLSAKPSPDTPERQTEPGKKWRETVSAKYIDGDVVLDAKTGAPLQVRLDANYSFVRDGQPLQATVTYQQSMTGEAGEIAAPPDYATLGRSRPLLDRQQLLEGLK
jgi:hypothetical protein